MLKISRITIDIENVVNYRFVVAGKKTVSFNQVAVDDACLLHDHH